MSEAHWEENDPSEETEPAFEHSASEDSLFEEVDIEEAYLQALRASEEAGLMASAPRPLTAEELAQQQEYAAIAEMERSLSAPAAPVPKTPPIKSEATAPTRPQFSAQQIIEALLFVGGEKLTARKIANQLGHNCPEESVQRWIGEINDRYTRQARPYEIVLSEEGYQMTLRHEYQMQRHQVFGVVPREVKLSQEAMEVLAFVAYKQPVTPEQIQEIDRPNTMAALRQLVRRELVSVQKREDKTPEYRTTDRFLRLFSLDQLTDLPRTRELTLK